MLDYAGIVCGNKIGSSYLYQCMKPQFLEYISRNDMYAYMFLFVYLYHDVMQDSGFLPELERFRTNNTREEFSNLKSNFQKFILGNTNINGNLEINRIFPKVLNIFAVEWNIKGTQKGKLSDNVYYFSDLSYNTPNFRDRNKPKNTPRGSFKPQSRIINNEEYAIARAKNIIKYLHPESEIRDKLSGGDATQIHHIFSRMTYPQYSADIENLIRLTPTQHYTKAHPNNKTSEINKSYQSDLIIAKSFSIENSLQNNEPYYSIDKFIKMLNHCRGMSLDPTSTMDTIRKKIRENS